MHRKGKSWEGLKGCNVCFIVIVCLESRTEASWGASWAKNCLHMRADGATNQLPWLKTLHLYPSRVPLTHSCSGSALFSLPGMPSPWPEKLEQECMPFQKTWLKWTPKWSWRCLPASWGKGWRGCKAQGASQKVTRSSLKVSTGAPRIQRTVQAIPKSWTLETLYEIPESAYLFGQVASTVLSNTYFSLLVCFVFQKIYSLTDFFFLFFEILPEKKKLKRSSFQMPSLISLAIKGKTTVFSSLDFSNQFYLAAFFPCLVWGPGGDHLPCLK